MVSGNQSAILIIVIITTRTAVTMTQVRELPFTNSQAPNVRN